MKRNIIRMCLWTLTIIHNPTIIFSMDLFDDFIYICANISHSFII